MLRFFATIRFKTELESRNRVTEIILRHNYTFIAQFLWRFATTCDHFLDNRADNLVTEEVCFVSGEFLRLFWPFLDDFTPKWVSSPSNRTQHSFTLFILSPNMFSRSSSSREVNNKYSHFLYVLQLQINPKIYLNNTKHNKVERTVWAYQLSLILIASLVVCRVTL